MKKILSLALVLMMVFALAACSSGNQGESAQESKPAAGQDDFKVGFIFIGDENEGYTAAHYTGVQEMKENLKLTDEQVIIKWNVTDDQACYDAAVDLCEQGCKLVIGNSFGYEDYLIQAAAEYPEVEFASCCGFQAASSGLNNMHDYFTKVYQARYAAGVAAGLKLNEMIKDGKITEDQAKIGYVGAYPYAEIISGFTSFYLGARSQCPSATMEVTYTHDWSSFDLEKETADKLIADGCVLISQHSDTSGPATACEAAGVPVVGYNVSMISTAPNNAITSAAAKWAPYFTYAVQAVRDGETMGSDWSGGYAESADGITELNEAVAAEGTADKVKEVEEAIANGELQVFDTSKFTVKGSSLEELVEKDKDYAKYADLVSDGYFHESEQLSTPSFDIIIDGITVNN